MTTDLVATAREEYSDGYAKAYKNIPDLCDEIDRLRREVVTLKGENETLRVMLKHSTPNGLVAAMQGVVEAATAYAKAQGMHHSKWCSTNWSKERCTCGFGPFEAALAEARKG